MPLKYTVTGLKRSLNCTRHFSWSLKSYENLEACNSNNFQSILNSSDKRFENNIKIQDAKLQTICIRNSPSPAQNVGLPFQAFSSASFVYILLQNVNKPSASIPRNYFFVLLSGWPSGLKCCLNSTAIGNGRGSNPGESSFLFFHIFNRFCSMKVGNLISFSFVF